MIKQDDMDNMSEDTSKPEKDAAYSFARSIYYTGAIDELVAGALQASLGGVITSLKELSKRKSFPKHVLQDFADNIAYGRHLVGVLSSYTTYDWEETLIALKQFEDRLGELK